MVINHNMNAANALRNSNINQGAAAKSMEKLSSGLKINRAGDDAAGLSISEKMRAQIRGLNKASTNAQDGISMIQTAEGALNETHNILQRMRELAVQAGNGTNAEADKTAIQEEINQLTSEINRIGNTTEFNTQKLLNGEKADANSPAEATVEPGELNGATGAPTLTGTYAGTTDKTVVLTYDKDSNKWKIGDDELTDTNKVVDGVTIDVSGADVSGVTAGKTAKYTVDLKAAVTVAEEDSKAVKLQIGANEHQSMSVEIADMRAAALGLVGTDDNFTSAKGVSDGTKSEKVENALDVSTQEKAGNAVTKINDAIEKVSAQRSKLGAIQNRLEHTIANLDNASENLTAAESRIRDVNMAKEMSEYSKNNILQQAAQAMLAQANQLPQNVLQLLR